MITSIHNGQSDFINRKHELRILNIVQAIYWEEQKIYNTSDEIEEKSQDRTTYTLRIIDPYLESS